MNKLLAKTSFIQSVSRVGAVTQSLRRCMYRFLRLAANPVLEVKAKQE